MTSIGFIGLGNMGGPMALNLVKAGHAVRVFDLVESAMNELVEAGATRLGASAGVAILKGLTSDASY